MPTLLTDLTQCKTFGEFTKAYANALAQSYNLILMPALEAAIQALEKCFQSEKTRLFLIGNGGSVSVASHFQYEVNHRLKVAYPHARAFNLCGNPETVSYISHASGFENVFLEQLERQAHKGDLLFAFSVTGNDQNILKACQWAKANKVLILGVSGYDGGKLKELADIPLHIPTPKPHYDITIDLFQVLTHSISCYLDRGLQR
ncbi:MAG: hypothetical protein A2Y14_00515 [Verrucomicrobia bacterium GWF2_51_19]|nr:MAG: hypothetical protein A2Y14_00515 [Verrucomicrobia bacterium GWF2_51_19]HCJ11869.1 hypothetical protein [Opitutae bacterium]